VTRARKHRRGRHLTPHDAHSLITKDGDLSRLHQRLCADGYVLKPTVRPYLRLDGFITLKFVWRKRSRENSSTFESTIHVKVPAGNHRKEAQHEEVV